MFKDFLAKQPIDKIIKTIITDNKVAVPIKIDTKNFYKDFQQEIDQETLTTEKAIFLASLNSNSEMKTSIDLLNAKL